MDKQRTDAYGREALERWGGTEAYKEYERRGIPPEGVNAAAEGFAAIFAEIGGLKDRPADDPAVRDAIAGLQRYITEHFYTCTDKILAGLGEMYSADPRFKKTIDEAGGEGAAEFASAAIERYCKNPPIAY